MFLLRRPILALSESNVVRRALTKLPITRAVVDRFVAGEGTAAVVAAIAELRSTGRLATVDYLGEFTTDPAQADATVAAYLALLPELERAGLVEGTEFSVKLSALGALLPSSARVPDGGEAYALHGVEKITTAAYELGARVTLDIEDHTTVDATLRTLKALRAQYPDVGIALQSMLYRTEADLASLTEAGSRVRLVKGAYHEPPEVAYTNPADVDLAYVRGLRILMEGDGYPMIGSHDPRLVAIGDQLAARNHRSSNDYEHQMLYGIRPDEQTRLVTAGKTVRVYVPYGADWYGYFTRRLAERPANLMFFLRGLATKG